MQVWNVLHATCWKYRTQSDAKTRHLRTITQICRAMSLQLRHLSTIGKKVVKQQYLLHISLQYGELHPTSSWIFGSGVWSTPANFNGFRILSSLLQQRRSPQIFCTCFVWPWLGLPLTTIHYVLPDSWMTCFHIMGQIQLQAWNLWCDLFIITHQVTLLNCTLRS